MSYEKLEVTKGLMEAYVGMYAPQEEVVEDTVEQLNEAPQVDLFSLPAMKAAREKQQQKALSDVMSGEFSRKTANIVPNPTAPRNPLTLPAAPTSAPKPVDVFKGSPALQKARDAAGAAAAASLFGLKPGSGGNPPRQGSGGNPPRQGSGGNPPRVSSPAAARTAPAGGTVLAKQGGVEGKLDKATGKFTAGAFTDAEKSRYASVAAKNAPKPGTQAAGPESIKPKTPNPLMKDMPSGVNSKENEALRGSTALASMASSPNANRLLNSKIGQQSAERVLNAPTPKPTPAASTTSTAFKAPQLAGSSSSAMQSTASAAGAKAFPVKPATSAQATAATTKPVAPEVKATNTAAAAPKPVTANPSASTPSGGFSTKPGDGKPYKDGPLWEETVDVFDVVMEYLVAEGYADTNQAALVIMANMSEEWREEILEAKYGTAAGRKALAKKIRKGENIGKMGPGTGFKAVERAAERGGAEDPTAVAAAAMYKTYGGKKG